MPTDRARRDLIKGLAAAAAIAIPTSAVVSVAQGAPPHSASRTSQFNILAFGAIGDGKTLCTAAIQKAVDACAQSGGGSVVISAGRYLTGAIFLKSNLHIEIQAGGVLLFTTDFDRVPSVEGRWEGIDRTVYASLFTGMDLENVSIAGPGTLDGQGETWWKAFHELQATRKKLGLTEREPENPPGSALKWGRPRMINLYRCRNVQIRELTIVNSPSWNIHPVLCENLLIDGVTITAPNDSPNTDGIDPDSCKNVRISNCSISVGDDCIIIKSGYKYQEHGTPCEDIAVTNCVFGTGHAGVGIGSETSGGVKNVVVSNCICDGTDRGLRFKTARNRGNVVENIRASNVIMRNVGEAITLTMFYNGGDIHHAEPVDARTPTFRNFHFSDILATNVKHAAVIEGLAEMPIREVTIVNFSVDAAAAGITCTNAIGVRFDNLVVNTLKGPALACDDTRELEVVQLTTRQPKSDAPVIRFQRVDNAVLQLCSAPEGTDVFLEVSGMGNRDISLIDNRLTRAAHDVALTNGATDAAIIRRN